MLPLLLALPYRLAGAPGAFATMGALAAALAWLFLRLAADRFGAPADGAAPSAAVAAGGDRAAASAGGALLAWALFAFAPPLLLYSHQVWVEVPAALLVVLALDALPGVGRRRGATLLFWAMVVLLPLLKLRFAVFAGLLAVLAWWRSGRRVRGLAAIAAGMALLFAAILAFNRARFDAALKTYGLEQLLPESPADVILLRALGLFFDAGFGVLAAAPLWLLLFPAFVALLRRRRRLAAEIAFLVTPYLLLVCFRREWFGGWSPPFRYGVTTLPLLALALVPLFAQRRRGGARLLLAALATATAGLTLLWLAVPGWTYSLADGGNFLLAALGQELRLDLVRLLPSAIRPRAASWWWPLVALPLVLLLWRWPRRPRPVLVALGAALALVAPAAALVAAARLPTRVVELEDPQVATSGGALFPSRWTFDRPRFRGAWHLAGGSTAEAPVVPGGARLRLRLWCQAETGAAQLVVGAGQTILAATTVPAAPWRAVDLGPFAWPPGRPPLVLALDPASAPLLVDRVELDWE
jgi:hypothetical protein